MRKYVCDRCGKVVRRSSKIHYFNEKTGDVDVYEFREPRTKKDICDECRNELLKLKKNILRENQDRIQVWFTKSVEKKQGSSKTRNSTKGVD